MVKTLSYQDKDAGSSPAALLHEHNHKMLEVERAGLECGLFLVEGQEYKNNRTKLAFRCKRGHTVLRTPESINTSLQKKSKFDCSRCRGLVRHKAASRRAEKNGGSFLSDDIELERNKKYRWKCKKGHVWMATYRSVVEGKHWCTECVKDKQSARQLLDLAEVRKNIESKNGTLLTPRYRGNLQALNVLCGFCGNVFSIKYREVRQGSWCPCLSLSKEEVRLKAVLERIFSCVAYRYRGFDWLKHKCNLELDFYVPEAKLAIEYDGGQHYRPVLFFGGLKNFTKTKKRDFLKNKLIHQNKQYINHFIRIPYWEDISMSNVLKILERNGVSV